MLLLILWIPGHSFPKTCLLLTTTQRTAYLKPAFSRYNLYAFLFDREKLLRIGLQKNINFTPSLYHQITLEIEIMRKSVLPALLIISCLAVLVFHSCKDDSYLTKIPPVADQSFVEEFDTASAALARGWQFKNASDPTG